MKCAKCGEENHDNAKFCISCGSLLHSSELSSLPHTTSVPDIDSLFPQEKRIHIGIVIIAILLGVAVVIIGIAGTAMAYPDIASGDVIKGMERLVGAFSWAFYLGILSTILQSIVVYRWSHVLNANIAHSRNLVDSLAKGIWENRTASEVKSIGIQLRAIVFNTWAFWVYLAFYLISLIAPSPGDDYIGFVGFIFLAIYLKRLFELSEDLGSLKTQLYCSIYQRNAFAWMHQIIKPRKIILTMVLIFFTFGIYWYYLLYALSKEINAFLNADQEARESIWKKDT